MDVNELNRLFKGYEHNIQILFENISFICTRYEHRTENFTKMLPFLHVSKALSNKFYIFQQCTSIVYWCSDHRL